MSRFVPDPTLNAQLAVQPAFIDAKRDAGRTIKRYAIAFTPRGKYRGGATRRAFIVRVDGATVRVGNTDPFFHLTEFGSANNVPYAPLRRGARAAGLRLDETPKT